MFFFCFGLFCFFNPWLNSSLGRMIKMLSVEDYKKHLQDDDTDKNVTNMVVIFSCNDKT